MLNVGRIHNEYTNWQKVQTPCVYLKFNPPGKTVVSSSDLSLNYWCLHHCFPSISKDIFKKVMKSVLGIVEMCSEVHKGELLSQNSTCSRSKTTRFLVFDMIYQVIPVISWDGGKMGGQDVKLHQCFQRHMQRGTSALNSTTKLVVPGYLALFPSPTSGIPWKFPFIYTFLMLGMIICIQPKTGQGQGLSGQAPFLTALSGDLLLIFRC